jgi:GABA(A) receptor-associated protein
MSSEGKDVAKEDVAKEGLRIRKKYPNRVPIMCTVDPSSAKSLPPLDKEKYLVPEDLTVGQFTYVIRKRIKLKPETALFMMCKGTFPSTSTEILTLYEEHKGPDHFLWLTVAAENTFG